MRIFFTSVLTYNLWSNHTIYNVYTTYNENFKELLNWSVCNKSLMSLIYGNIWFCIKMSLPSIFQSQRIDDFLRVFNWSIQLKIGFEISIIETHWISFFLLSSEFNNSWEFKYCILLSTAINSKIFYNRWIYGLCIMH